MKRIDRIIKTINETPSWVKTEMDSFLFFESFSNDELKEIKNELLKKIEELSKREVSKKELEKKEKEFEEYCTKLVEDGLCEIRPGLEGLEKFSFRLDKVKNRSRDIRVKWIIEKINYNFGIRPKIKEDLERKKYFIKNLDEFPEEAKQKIKEWQKKDGKISQNRYKEILEEQPDPESFLSSHNTKLEELKQEKKKFLRKTYQKEAKIEQFKRVIWFLEIEERLREHEKKFEIEIIRDKIVWSNSKEFQNYPIFVDDSGEIFNIFLIECGLPYRIKKYNIEKTLGAGYYLSTMYVENVDQSFRDFCCMGKEKHPMNYMRYGKCQPVPYPILLSKNLPRNTKEYTGPRFANFFVVEGVDEENNYEHELDNSFKWDFENHIRSVSF